MNRLPAHALALALVFSAPLASAQAIDSGAAREQLKQGFALKQQGKFAEAIPHLLESLRLDPQLKTLMNLADAEQRVGKLVDSTRHWVEARDRAASAGDEASRVEAETKLAAAEARMPRLTILLKGADPSVAIVKRDAIVLGAVSLGVPLPSDPGAHVILVEAAGFEPRTFDVTLKEGERRSLDVTPGEKKPVVVPVPSRPANETPPPASSPAVAPPTEPAAGAAGRPQRIAGFVTAGVGVLAFGVSAFQHLAAKNKHEDALGHCIGNECDVEAFRLQDDAKSAAKTGNIFALTGALLVIGGGVLVFTAPRGAGPVATQRLAPAVSANGGGLVWKGAF